MKDSKKKQIKFESEHPSGSPAAEQQRTNLSHPTPKSREKNTRQTTLEEFIFIAEVGVKDPNVP